MSTGIEQLKKRVDALAPGPAPVEYHYLSSTDFKDEKEREARRVELERISGSRVILCDCVGGARSGEPEGPIRVFWKDDE